MANYAVDFSGERSNLPVLSYLKMLNLLAEMYSNLWVS